MPHRNQTRDDAVGTRRPGERLGASVLGWGRSRRAPRGASHRQGPTS